MSFNSFEINLINKNFFKIFVRVNKIYISLYSVLYWLTQNNEYGGEEMVHIFNLLNLPYSPFVDFVYQSFLKSAFS